MKKMILNLLEELKHAGAAWQKEAKGDAVMKALSELLLDSEYRRLSTARAHWRDCGEGRGELDGICNELIAKYRADEQLKTFKRTLL